MCTIWQSWIEARERVAGDHGGRATWGYHMIIDSGTLRVGN